MKKFSLTIFSIIIFTYIVAFSLHVKNDICNSVVIIEKSDEENIEKEIIFDEYGIKKENYVIEQNRVRSRQNLANILSDFDIDNYTIHRIAGAMREIFEPRHIRAGNSYHGYLSGDSLKRLDYFVYDISPLTFLKIDLTDSVAVNVIEKETSTITKEASGIINSSLWNTMQENDLGFDLAIALSEVLAWEVDFYRIESGDRFKVIYDETYVDNTRIGIEKIHGVYFIHRGREIYGFNYEQDTIDGYFDMEGNNLRKVFLKSPLKFYRITSGYSRSRLHPVIGTRRPHLGTDYAAPAGTPIMSVGDGVVTERSYTGGNGNYIKIRHNSVYETQYLHMSRFAKGIHVGSRVKQGDIIGYVGSTGLATGPHVCFRFWKNGHQVNHRRLEFPSANPLPAEYIEEFFILRDRLKNKLDNLHFREEERLPA